MKAIHVLTVALALSLALAGLALANSSPERRRQVLGSGASEATNGTIRLRGTLGQPIVGDISARDVVLEQGFWHGARYHIYLPLVTRNYQP
jgi:hypothetical protein